MVTMAVWAGEIEPEIVAAEPTDIDPGLTAQDRLELPLKTVIDCE